MSKRKGGNNALEHLRERFTSTVKDMSISKFDAWTYGIIVGWNHGAYKELKKLHNWSDEEIELNINLCMNFQNLLSTSKKTMETYTNQDKWISVDNELPEDGIEVIGYSEKWIHPDFNTGGTRVCFINNGEWNSAKWNNDQDSWHTHAEWCCRDNGGKHFEPTHWQEKPLFVKSVVIG